MSNGIVAELKQKPSGVWYMFIKDDVTREDFHYTLKPGEESKFPEGTKVVFDKASGQPGATRQAAVNVRLPGTEIQQPKHPGSSRNTEPAISTGFYLPKDTAALLQSVPFKDIESTALKAQKYIPRTPPPLFKITKEQSYSPVEKNLLAGLAKKQLDILKTYNHYHCVTGILGSRMTVGLGGGSVFETAITLHHTYGFPYIPGSTLKGCMRGFIIRDSFAGDEKGALANEDFEKVFGSQEQRGEVFFLDAFPSKCEKLELDIMNPHYGDYYKDNSGRTAPTDDMSPNPLKYYAVPKGVQFIFRLVSNALDIKQFNINGSRVIKAFESTLSEIGIGAKTAVGYGWFGNVREVNE